MKLLSRLLPAVALCVGMATAAQAETVRIGIAAEPYPPFAEKGADGTWKGWEIEIIGAICEAMKADCEIVEVAWDGIIPALLAKKMDAIMASMSITDERKKTIDFSDKYYNTPGVIVATKGSKIDSSPASVEGKIIGIQVATIHMNYAKKYYPDAEVKSYSTFDEHNQDLVAGRVDAVIADSVALQPFLTSSEGGCCEIKGELIDEEIFGIGVGAGIRQGETALKEKINAAIQEIRKNGKYEEISKKYFDFDIYGG